MLDYRIELLSAVLLIILVIVITPLMVTIFTDVLPTNKNMEIDEIINRLISEGSTAEYIVSSDYLYIVETKKDNKTKKHYAYKGKTSGFIPTSFTYGTADRIKRYSDLIPIDDIYINLILKKHNGKYVLEFITMGSIVSLIDNEGKEINHIGPRFFLVLESVEENWEIVGKYNDSEFKVLDRELLFEYLEDEK